MDANDGLECIRMKNNGVYDTGDFYNCNSDMPYICQHI